MKLGNHLGLSAALMLSIGVSSLVKAAEVGKPAPGCELTAAQTGKRQTLQDFKGKLLYVDFWASWCPPCVQSFPFMSKLSRELGGRGLRVVGVNVDEEDGAAEAFLASHPPGFTVAMDASKSCAQAFGVEAMPSSYLVDGQGVVRYVHHGFRPGEAEQVRALVEKLLAEPVAAAPHGRSTVAAAP